eukprot:1159827-Pelagomonas_calceolata.AAC.23
MESKSYKSNKHGGRKSACNVGGALLTVPMQDQWPGVFWRAQEALERGQAVEVPRPHPKFTVQVRRRCLHNGEERAYQGRMSVLV